MKLQEEETQGEGRRRWWSHKRSLRRSRSKRKVEERGGGR